MRIISVALLAAISSAAGLFVQQKPIFAQDVGIVQSDIVIVDPERLFEQTDLGRMFLAQVQQEREELITQNTQIQTELEAEEQALTIKRDELAPEEFRELADAFDQKVQEIRRGRDRRARELERRLERAPLDFMRQVEPVLIDIMRSANARVVLDARNVLYRSDVIDITDLAIARIDASFEVRNEQAGGAEPEDAPSGEDQQ